MRLLGNLLWLMFAGVWLAMAWLCAAVLLAITVIGLPFAFQCVKIASFALWPFGRTVVTDRDPSVLSVVLGVLWLIPGVVLALLHAVAASMLAMTIIGFPFAVQALKLAGLALQPFGRSVKGIDR